VLRIDGRDLRDVTLESLRFHIGSLVALSEARFCVEFVVPLEMDIREEPPFSEFFTSPPEPNPVMEKIRSAVGSDSRWNLARVASLRPNSDPEHQHMLVWVWADEAAQDEVRVGVYDIVTELIPAARLAGIQQET